MGRDADGNEISLLGPERDNTQVTVEEVESPELDAMWDAVAKIEADPTWASVEETAATARELRVEAAVMAYAQTNSWRMEGHPDLFATCVGARDLQEAEEALTRWVATEAQNRSVDEVDADVERLVLMMDGVSAAIDSWETPLGTIWLDVYDCLTMPTLCHAGKSAQYTQAIISSLT